MSLKHKFAVAGNSFKENRSRKHFKKHLFGAGRTMIAFLKLFLGNSANGSEQIQLDRKEKI